MRIDFGRRPDKEPIVFKEDDTRFDGVTVPMVTSQGENSVVFRKVFRRREKKERTVSIPGGVGRKPILGQNIAAAPSAIPIETEPCTYGTRSLTSLGVQLATMGIARHQDSLHSFIETEHSVDAVMQTASVPE